MIFPKKKLMVFDLDQFKDKNSAILLKLSLPILISANKIYFEAIKKNIFQVSQMSTLPPITKSKNMIENSGSLKILFIES